MLQIVTEAQKNASTISLEFPVKHGIIHTDEGVAGVTAG